MPMTRRLNYANVTATLALLFAMSGGALAANHYLINSTKQINPKVLRALKGKIGPTGPAGLRGLQGPTGPAGPKGKTGTVSTSKVRPFAWGQVREDASLRPHSASLITVTHPEKGLYCLLLSGSPEQSELEGTSVTLAGTTPQAVFPRITNGQGADCAGEHQPAVAVRFYNSSSKPEDARFSFIVP